MLVEKAQHRDVLCLCAFPCSKCKLLHKEAIVLSPKSTVGIRTMKEVMIMSGLNKCALLLVLGCEVTKCP